MSDSVKTTVIITAQSEVDLAAEINILYLREDVARVSENIGYTVFNDLFDKKLRYSVLITYYRYPEKKPKND